MRSISAAIIALASMYIATAIKKTDVRGFFAFNAVIFLFIAIVLLIFGI